jgi:dTDP-4-dehydrorhamnose 3,5-epimerase
MMLTLRETPLIGCLEIQPTILKDQRGYFIKTFHADFFKAQGLNIQWREEYYSVSAKGVLRGLHFQTPPHDHEKLVYCTAGEVLDAVVDLRTGSPSYGDYTTFHLKAETANMIYVPKGFAHGFLTLSESATMMYKVATVYAPEHDAGILWNSAGIEWPVETPILSERDKGFPSLADFVSPFAFSPKEGA